ncbi:hypothetical protein KDN24_15530 [Bacillus sp. Bva_UNVM-123]|uniref:hypothetical protein n=1 Tax=Bacillus sp. Bva_UNVM-123 TaxID=2829798 RepID=UPI00391FBAA5
MRILDRIQEEYRKSKFFFILKVLISIIAIYFAFRVIFISISGLRNASPLPDNMNLLLFGMLFFLGLSNAVQLVEMSMNKKKEYFKLLFVSTILSFGGSVFILLM